MNGFLTIVEFRKIDGPPGPPIGVRITLEDIEQTITPFGFKRKKILDAGLYHHGMVFKRVAE